MSEELEDYTKTYTSFSGADMMAVLNKQIIGEVQGVYFEEDLRSLIQPVKGHIDVCVFDKDRFRQGLQHRDNEFVLVAANEYGQTLAMEYEGIVFTKRTGGVTVDDIYMMERYHFTANRIVYKDGIKPSDYVSSPSPFVPDVQMSKEIEFKPEEESK